MTSKTDREIDEIVDALVKDEGMAQALKSRLHGQDAPEEQTEQNAPPQTTEPPAKEPRSYARSDAHPKSATQDRGADDEDMWDNLPV